MTLSQQIENDLKESMKAREEHRLSTLRMVRAAFKNKQIDLGHELTDEEAQAVMRTMLKQYKDALTDFTSAGRSDLAERQAEEIKLIETYLPQQMSEDELTKICQDAITELGAAPSDLGKAMGVVMKKLAGRADGNKVREIMQKILAGEK
ncbi:MAG: GatB/YqeY domain-containing protein [Patescibacteria group bacterium]